MAYVEATWITNLATAVDVGMNRQQGGRRNFLPLFLACHASPMARLVRIVVPGLPQNVAARGNRVMVTGSYFSMTRARWQRSGRVN
jgi:hypothetical protein